MKIGNCIFSGFFVKVSNFHFRFPISKKIKRNRNWIIDLDNPISISLYFFGNRKTEMEIGNRKLEIGNCIFSAFLVDWKSEILNCNRSQGALPPFFWLHHCSSHREWGSAREIRTFSATLFPPLGHYSPQWRSYGGTRGGSPIPTEGRKKSQGSSLMFLLKFLKKT
jgi:hypothetical protein